MDYQTYEPQQDLNAFVKCYWTLDGPRTAIPEKQTIVPDGCMEMIFHYGDLYKQYAENSPTACLSLPTGQAGGRQGQTGRNSIVQPRCFVIGQLTRPLEIEPTGEIGIFAVRFHPDGFSPFMTIPIKEMENTAISLERLFGKAAREIERKVLRARTASDRIIHIETFLLSRLTSVETIDRVVKSTVETILMANGQLSVAELSKKTDINRRQLERKFATAIGLSPKQLSKTIKLQTALKLLLNGEFNNLTALAYEGEYYDQAHFIKDFKELTGVTPKEFYGENLKMSALFYGTD